ncbi:SDR family NAD(P)-dependent oxidoreductase [Streptomyces alfalfae]|uniref:SDR family NAD(P)-dependent oxidoreductase n=1 Tax=Streptomyces alfalfae TaxID=1642299 RepID=A0A7T4PKQ3_9ACTN|nr:SDR family NAD(P)-dependent oxidoreductase [Streptomyces alfalfae]QQC92080.1 SDR family NAD(P)-dependent oxidoreductase [Streptomyces alfalfae]
MHVAESVVLVTGGASGLGLATVEKFSAAGAGVVIADLPSSPGEEVAARLGDRVVFRATDVTSEEQVTAALDTARELGTLRIAVNCAGVSSAVKTVGRRGPFPLAEFDRVVRTNLVGTFNVLRLAAERIGEAEEVDGERGVVINTASIAAYDGQVGQVAYAASKGGIVGMTLPAARDLAPLKIRVVTIAPGMFRTPLLTDVPEKALAALGDQVAHPARFGRPEEYADLALHVAENAMLNAETIRLDGAVRLG